MCWGQPLISITIREKISSSLLLINFKSWIKICYIFVLYYYFSNCTFYYVSIIPIDLFIYLLIYFFNLRLYVVNTISFLLQLRSITSNNGVVILIWSYGLLFVYNFWVKEKKGEITVSNGKWRQRSLTWLLSSLLQNLSFSHWHTNILNSSFQDYGAEAEDITSIQSPISSPQLRYSKPLRSSSQNPSLSLHFLRNRTDYSHHSPRYQVRRLECFGARRSWSFLLQLQLPGY